MALTHSALKKCVAALAIGGAALAGAPAAAADCPGGDAQPNELSADDYSASLLCEVNQTRRAHGLDPLSWQRNLDVAAGWHANDMVDKGYFAHTAPDGDSLAERLDRVNFIPAHSDRWSAGENLAAGRGPGGTPAAIVDGWLNSPEHRVNLLDPGFTMVGIGVTRGWPQEGASQSNSMTIDMDMGWRAARR
jgi:uncharacterized protein YkwD